MIQRMFTLIGRLLYWLGWPFWYVVLSHTKRARVLVVSQDKALLARSYISSGGWELPGGGIRGNETPESAAARELYEETGIEIPPAQLTRLGEDNVSRRGITYQGYFMLANLESEEALTRQKIEIAELRWFPIAELFGDQTGDVAQALNLWREKQL